MKKSVLLLTFTALCITCNNSFAQNITFGLKGGCSIPNLTGGSSDNPLNTGYSSRLAGDGGIYGEYHMNKKFSVSVGLEYSAQGGLKDKFQAFPTPSQLTALGYETPYLYADFKSEAKINYVIVPLLARYTWKMSKKSPVKIYMALGPFVGYLINAKQVTSGSSLYYLDAEKKIALPLPEQSFDAVTGIKSDLNKLNAGINGFVGISYSFDKKNALFIEGGGNYGFIPIQKGTVNGKNNTGAGVITLGYAYTFQKKYRARR